MDIMIMIINDDDDMSRPILPWKDYRIVHTRIGLSIKFVPIQHILFFVVGFEMKRPGCTFYSVERMH